MTANTLEMEWSEAGCVAKATGFKGVMLTCPRCNADLPRNTEHRCGDMAAAVKKTKARKGKP